MGCIGMGITLLFLLLRHILTSTSERDSHMVAAKEFCALQHDHILSKDLSLEHPVFAVSVLREHKHHNGIHSRLLSENLDGIFVAIITGFAGYMDPNGNRFYGSNTGDNVVQLCHQKRLTGEGLSRGLRIRSRDFVKSCNKLMKSPLIKDFDISYGAPTGLVIRLKTLHGFKEIHLEESHLNMPDIQEVLNEASLLVRMVKSETQARS